MNASRQVIVCAVWIALYGSWAIAAEGSDAVELARVDSEHSQVRLEAARIEDQPALAVVFTGTDDCTTTRDPKPPRPRNST
jgi:hypothetical protein